MTFERVNYIYPKNIYQLRKTVFEKLDSFNVLYRKDQKLFKNFAVFDFESICVKEEMYIEELKLQNGLENKSPYRFQFRQT